MSHTEAPLKVLFVDDEVEILDALRRQISLMDDISGFFVSDPLEVYEIVDLEDIDVIVTDVVMPEKDGISLLQDIKVDHPEIVRILLTAYGDYNTSLRAINEAEVFGFITKPWEQDYLYGHLRMARQMLSYQFDNSINTETPMLVIATWDDATSEISTLHYTGNDEILARHFATRVFMISAALFGDKYRFQNNLFTLPLKESRIVVRGYLLRENNQNYGLFIYDHDVEEDNREIFDKVIFKMEELLQADIEASDLEILKGQINPRNANLS